MLTPTVREIRRPSIDILEWIELIKDGDATIIEARLKLDPRDYATLLRYL